MSRKIPFPSPAASASGNRPQRAAPARALADGSVPCVCNLAVVQDAAARTWEPVLTGHIGGAPVHLLAALLPLVEDELRARARRRRKRETSVSLLAQNEFPVDPALQQEGIVRHATDRQPADPGSAPTGTYNGPKKGPRPCVIWKLKGYSEDSVQVLLMGTFGGKPPDELALELRPYITAVYTPALPQTDWSKIRHVHASPPWGAPSIPWIIPLPVDVDLEHIEPYANKFTPKSIVADDECHFINTVSLRRLDRLHVVARKRMALTLSSNIAKQRVAKDLLAHTNLKTVFEKGDIIYEHVQAIQGAPWAQHGEYQLPQVPTASTSRAHQASGWRPSANARTSQPSNSVGGAPYTAAATTSHLPRINEQFELESLTATVTETRMGAKAQATSPTSIASSSQAPQRPRRLSLKKWSDVVKGWAK